MGFRAWPKKFEMLLPIPALVRETVQMSFQEILFVSHDAGRTGAPLVLLNFQRWLKEHTGVKFATILRRRGPLEAEFARLGEVFLIEAPQWEHLTLGRR